MRQQQHHAGSSTATSLLLDAPDAWLAQLLSGQYLDSDSKLGLFKTCKKLNEMVMQNSSSTSLKLDVLDRPRDRMLNMLQTANRHALSINLCLNHHETQWENDMQMQMMQVVCSILEEAAAQGATTAVTNIELKGKQYSQMWIRDWYGTYQDNATPSPPKDAKMETMLPPAVSAACPNLVKLSLDSCILQLDRTATLKQHYPNLRTLALKHCDLNEAVGGPQQADCTSYTAMQGLAALTSLTIVTHEDTKMHVELNIINSLAAPLTHLCFDTSFADKDMSVEQDLIKLTWAQLGATLQHLELPAMSVGDGPMELFLAMPFLTRVRVHYFELEKSYAGRPCKWEELMIEWSIDAKILAYLPLHPGLLLKIGDKSGIKSQFDMDTDTCHLLPQAISNVKRAKALEWTEGHAALSASNMEASEFASHLAQALLLIKDVTNLEISTYNCDLNEIAMQALCRFAVSKKDELKIDFNSIKRVAGDMMALVAHMPHNGLISFQYEDPDVEQHIIQLCCAARRKFSLVAYQLRSLDACRMVQQPFCEQRIRYALQAGGIDVLNMEIMDGCRLDITVQPRLS